MNLESLIPGWGTLKNIMIWHTYGKKLSYDELPVLDILKEWREFSGVSWSQRPHRQTT